MSTIEQIRTSLAPDLARLEDRIRQHLATDNPLLQNIITNCLKSKGKMVRPIMVILTARMLGEVNEHVISAAAAAELLHNASLVHDDVVDGSVKRRGQPTINAVWDNHIAVLVGDFFVSTSLQLALETERLEIVRAVARLGRSLSLGELDQIYTAYHHTLDEDSYYRIIAYKTASLFQACASMGAEACDVRDSRAHALTRFAHLLGLCFQVRDDVFDYFTDPAVGKPTGNDLREGKITLPLLYALHREDLPEHREMNALVRKDSLSDSEIAQLIDFAVRAGGIDYAYQSMEQMRVKALKELDIFPDSEDKTMLLDLFSYIIARNH